MTANTIARVVGCLLVALCATAAQAQKADDAKPRRLVHVVKHGDAKALAAALAKHFKGEVEVEVAPGTGSLLLINAAPSAFDEVLKVLEQIDRRPQLVSVEVQVLTVAAAKGEEKKELDPRELTGETKQVQAKVRELQKQGLVGETRLLQITAAENQPARVLVGEIKAFVVGVIVRPGGAVSRNINYRNTGTTLSVTPRNASDKGVTLELKAEDSRMHFPEDAPPVGNDEKGQPIRAPEFTSANVETKLAVPAGHTVAVEGVKTDAKAGRPQTVILVTARVIEAK
jgi:type II secretory pathway component GspD/PulD (secretin)